jgi:hypothetical protein
MRITQIVLAAAGVLLFVLGSPVLGVVAVAVGVGAFLVSRTDAYEAIYFEQPDEPAPVCSMPLVRPAGSGCTSPRASGSRSVDRRG